MSLSEAILSIGYWRDRLAENINAQGVAAQSSETLAQLVPKVLQIDTGGAQSVYTGSYIITPSVIATPQVIATAGKYLTDDVTIHTIPTSETLNAAGGYTFTIGG